MQVKKKKKQLGGRWLRNGAEESSCLESSLALSCNSRENLDKSTDLRMSVSPSVKWEHENGTYSTGVTGKGYNECQVVCVG